MTNLDAYTLLAVGAISGLLGFFVYATARMLWRALGEFGRAEGQDGELEQ